MTKIELPIKCSTVKRIMHYYPDITIFMLGLPSIYLAIVGAILSTQTIPMTSRYYVAADGIHQIGNIIVIASVLLILIPPVVTYLSDLHYAKKLPIFVCKKERLKEAKTMKHIEYIPYRQSRPVGIFLILSRDLTEPIEKELSRLSGKTPCGNHCMFNFEDEFCFGRSVWVQFTDSQTIFSNGVERKSW